MLRATAKPRFFVSRRSESLSLRTRNVTPAATSATTMMPNVTKIRVWSPVFSRGGVSAVGAASITLVRFGEVQLLDLDRGDSERIHLEPGHVVANADEARRVVERHERSREQDRLLGPAVRVHADLGIGRIARHVEERIDQMAPEPEVVAR